MTAPRLIALTYADPKNRQIRIAEIAPNFTDHFR
jgi:hypothetical protein